MAKSSTPKTSVLQSFSTDFIPKSFPASQNDSWIFFTPTALVNPEIQALEMTFWLKHLGEVDIRPIRLRYDVRLLEVLQLGIQANGISEKKGATSETPNTDKEKGLHSAYTSLKYQVADQPVLPVAVSLGLRKRVYWDDYNTDFNTRDEIDKTTDLKAWEDAKEVDDRNDKYNELTLIASATGKVESLGLLYNFYLDSQTIGAGVKFLLTLDIKLFADTIYYYYENAQISSDSALGVQVYNPVGSLSLNYQTAAEQVQLGLYFDF
ncbi:MAG: hypothetical protein GY866_09560 [Proteobacteria bacterium]|nr:hypothetical protein [Pseudomonadota bacterium]